MFPQKGNTHHNLGFFHPEKGNKHPNLGFFNPAKGNKHVKIRNTVLNVAFL